MVRGCELAGLTEERRRNGAGAKLELRSDEKVTERGHGSDKKGTKMSLGCTGRDRRDVEER